MAAGTLVRTAMLKITADDGDTESKLSRITAQAEELGRLHPDLTARINTAAASAKLKVLKAELNDTSTQAQETTGRFGALREAVNGLTLGLPSGYAEMGMLQKAIVAANLATGVAEPAVAGLTVAVGGLAAGVVAAGAGLGVFGIVAKSIWTQVTTAVTAYQAAQAAAGSATTSKARVAALAQEKAALAGLTGDQRALAFQVMGTESAWHKFTAAASPGVTGVMAQGLAMIPRVLSLIQPFLAPVEGALRQLMTELGSALWSKGASDFAKMLQGQTEPAIYMLGHAIGNIATGVGGILKAFMPVSQGVLAGIDKITAKFATWGSTLSGHSGFNSLQQMAKQDAPLLISALQKLAGIAKIVGSQMSSMTSFGNSKQFLLVANAVLQLVSSLLKAHPQLVYLALYAKLGADSLGKLKTAFSGISSGVSGIKSTADAVKNLSAGMKSSEKAADDATGAWGTFGGKLSSVGSGMKSAFSSIGSGLASAGSSVASFAAQTGRQLATATRATVVWIAEHAVAAGTFIAENVAMAISATAAFIAENAATLGLVVVIAALIAAIIYLATHWKQVWSDIKKWALDAWHFIDDSVIHPLMAGISAVVSWIESHWKLLVEIFTGPIGIVVTFIVSHWNQIVTVTKTLIANVIGFFKSLPGKIISALGDVGHMLWNAGAKIIGGLIGGIKSMIGGVTHAIGSVVSEITSHLPFSPAKKGPLSGRGDPRLAGQRIVAYLAQGMASQTQLVTGAARGVAQAAMVTGGGSAGGGAAGGGLSVQIGSSGGDGPVLAALVTALKKDIRVNYGGDVTRWARAGG